MKMPAGGGTATAFQSQQSATPMGPIAAAGGQVYWVTGSQTCNNIMRAATDGSGQTTNVHTLRKSQELCPQRHPPVHHDGKPTEFLRVPR